MRIKNSNSWKVIKYLDEIRKYMEKRLRQKNVRMSTKKNTKFSF